VHDSGSEPSAVPSATSAEGIVELRRGLNRMQRMLGSRRIQARLSQVAGVDLTHQAVQVLRVVGDGAARPVADVAAEAHMDVAAVSRQLRSLEGQHLLTRRASPDHGSVVLVEATSRGREVAARLEAVQQQHFAEALTGWSDDQCGELGRLLLRLVDDLQRTPYREP
jgi:DNA-binding MarR family transcriptional regulator